MNVTIEEATIEEAFSPVSEWIAKTFFNEKSGRTLTQKAKDDWGIPKQNFHSAIIDGTILFINYFDSKIIKVKQRKL